MLAQTVSMSVSWTLPYVLRKPLVYRHMAQEYVELFFNHGRLRLSSFDEFKKHPDEARRDEHEGFGQLTNVNANGQEQTVFAVMGSGHNAFVLCGSTTPLEPKEDRPQTTTGFLIHDTFNFLSVVGRRIPKIVAMMEGHCLYQSEKIIRRFGPGIDFDAMKISPDKNELDMGKMQAALMGMAGEDLVFLKPNRFAHEAEYRLVWAVKENVTGYLDIECPEAVEFCTPFEKVG